MALRYLKASDGMVIEIGELVASRCDPIAELLYTQGDVVDEESKYIDLKISGIHLQYVVEILNFEKLSNNPAIDLILENMTNEELREFAWGTQYLNSLILDSVITQNIKKRILDGTPVDQLLNVKNDYTQAEHLQRNKDRNCFYSGGLFERRERR